MRPHFHSEKAALLHQVGAMVYEAALFHVVAVSACDGSPGGLWWVIR